MIAAVILLPLSILAESKKQDDIFSEINSLNFVNHLYEMAEYQRVLYELDRYDYFYGNNRSNVLITRMLCMNKLEIPFETINYSKCDFLISQTLVIENFNHRMKVYTETELPASDTIDRNDEIIYYKRIFLNKLISNDFESAQSIVEQHNMDFIDFKEIDKMYNRFKSPYLGMLCGIFPGGGYIYAGNRNTGFTAFCVIGLCFTASYFASLYDSDYIAVASGTVGALFYGGSILGGYMESVRYNRQLQNRILRYVEYNYEFDKDRSYIFKKYGTGGISFKF